MGKCVSFPVWEGRLTRCTEEYTKDSCLLTHQTHRELT